MKLSDKFTPKYWAAHYIDADDILVDTTAKSLEGSQRMLKKYYPAAYEDYTKLEGVVKFSLFEVRLLEEK